MNSGYSTGQKNSKMIKLTDRRTRSLGLDLVIFISSRSSSVDPLTEAVLHHVYEHHNAKPY